MAGVDVLATAMNGANAQFNSQLYAKWVAAPNSVDPDFAALFAALNDEAKSVLTDANGASWAPNPSIFEAPAPESKPATPAGRLAKAGEGLPDTHAATLDSIRALMLIRSYRVRGHLEAQLDPLNLKVSGHHADLDPKSYGFTDADLDRQIYIAKDLGFEGDTASLRQIIDRLRESYCGVIGLEFMHIQEPIQAPSASAWKAARPPSRLCMPLSKPAPIMAYMKSPSACRIAAG